MFQDESIPSPSSPPLERRREEHVNLYQEEEEEEEAAESADDADEHDAESNPALPATCATAPLLLAPPQPQPQQPAPSLIRCMPEQTVRRIVAGQAILDLASAVKELLDNALDAQSTCINIRLFNQGIDLLEVSDDGVGVPLHSRPYLCTPHATSKLETLDDLQRGTCTTLGFRGEALYSLAHLSRNVVIATRTQHESLAQKMAFDQQGQLMEASVVEMPRKIGTTVCVQEFLHAVPVRRADFLRRLPTQRSKLIQTCQAYALFAAAGCGSGHNVSNGDGGSNSSSGNRRQRQHSKYYRAPCQLRLMDMISRNDGSADERIILQTPHTQVSPSSSTTLTPRCTVLLGRAISSILGTAVLQQLCEVSINVTDVVVAATALKKNSATASINAATATDHDDCDDDDDDLVNPDGTPRWTVAGFISKAHPPAATASLSATAQDSSSSSRQPPSAAQQVKASRRVGHIPTTNAGNPNQQGNNAGAATAAAAGAGHQFFSINGRPVEMPKLARLLNEQWRSCHNNNGNNKNSSSSSNTKDDATNRAKKNASTNKKQRGVGRPCLILQLTIPFQAYDINLSPDKRQAVLLGEDDVLQRIQQVVASLWQSQTNVDHVQFQSFEESEAAVAALSKAAAARDCSSRNTSSNSRSSSSCTSPANHNNSSDDALSSPLPSTTAEQLEGSGRFNRRYAFSHDVRKARLQHEFDDGRKKQDYSSGGNDDDDDNNDIDDDEEGGEERRRPDYNNYQPGYGPDENDDQLDAMLWQQEQIKRQLEAQEKERQRQQQQAAAAALFAARQKEQASSTSPLRRNSNNTSNNNSENNGREEKKQDATTDESSSSSSTNLRLTESSRLSVENAKTAQRIAAAASSMTSCGGHHANITPSPAAPRQFPQIAAKATTTEMTTTPDANDTDAGALSSCDVFMTTKNSDNNNDTERRRWQATQHRFNLSRDEDDVDPAVGGANSLGKAKSSTTVAAAAEDESLSSPLQSFLDNPPPRKGPPQKEDVLFRLNQFRAAGTANAAIESTNNNNDKMSCSTSSLHKQQSTQPKKTGKETNSTFSLEQFGFQKSTATTAKKTTAAISSKRTSNDVLPESALKVKRQKQYDDEANDYSEEQESSTLLLPVVSLHDQHAAESAPTPSAADNSADATMESQRKNPQEQDKDEQEQLADRYQRKRKRLLAPGAESSLEDPEEQTTTVAMNVVGESPGSVAEDDVNHRSGNINGSRSCLPSSQDHVFPTPSITWDTFARGGTNQVLLESRRERLAMHERKQSLQEMQQEQQQKDGKHDQADDNNLSASSSSSSRIVTLSKDDFKDMTIIGQFNKGFILTKSRNNHLWIMDQHACDEKYNFERLVKETVIHEQRLIAPMPLELSPAEETCILDHMEIFEKNGFRFQYRENAEPRHRLALTALPHSGARDGRKAVLFGKDDVSALCRILGCGDDGNNDDDDDDGEGDNLYRDGGAGGGTGTDGSGMYGNNAVRRYAHTGLRGTAASTTTTTPASGNADTADRVIARLPKAIAMFASRACRGSIMIGRALSSTEMQRVITHLGELDHPFTCAHGRPTMQHVSNIGPLLRQDEHKAAQHRAGPTVTVLSQEADDQNSDREEDI